MKFKGLDHFVLTVKDIQASVDFYQKVLGMKKISFGEGRVALKFSQQKINLHEYGKSFNPHAEQPLPGTSDFCLIVDDDIIVTMQQVASQGATIIEGPVNRTGALGPINSFYLRDPDGNLIEIAQYVE